MQGQNILDQSHPETGQFTNCKIRYLLAQNLLMTTQLRSIGALVEKYKSIIDLLSKKGTSNGGQNAYQTEMICKGKLDDSKKNDEPQQTELAQNNKDNCFGNKQDSINEEMVKNILGDAEKIIQDCMAQCIQITNTKNIFPQDQGTITPAFFSQLVLSYQKSISQLKHSIHQRQILLQDLQISPNHPMKRKQDYVQSSAIIKAIQSYDIYPKISEKCRKQILQLKQKKKQLQLESNSRVQNSSSIYRPKKLSNSYSNQVDKTLKKVSQYCNQSQNQVQLQTMSPFQKTILIYKKKKIFNDILQSKVINLKKKIKQKQQCNQILRKRLDNQNQIWNNIQNINHCVKRLQQDDPAYLSILNQSIKANNLDFSVDISRVMSANLNKFSGATAVVNVDNILSEVQKDANSDIKK